MTNENAVLTGTDIFNDETVVLKDGKPYTLRYSMYSLAKMEEEAGGFKEVFDIFQEYSFTNILKAIYFGIITDNKEFRGLKGDEILEFMDDLVDEDTLLESQILTLGQFNKFFAKLEKSKDKLPEKYQKVLDEMNEKQSKKK